MRPLFDQRLILVDDNPEALETTAAMLRAHGFDILAIAEQAEAIRTAREIMPLVILCRDRTAGINGLDLIVAVKRFSPCTNIVLLTESVDVDAALDLLRHGAFDVAQRPKDDDLLKSILTRATRNAELEELNLQYVDELATRERSLRSDLSLARLVIGDLLPSTQPETPHYDWGILSRPSTEIGGDFFHIAHYPEKNRSIVILADISGHGIPAALLLTLLKLRVSEIFARYTAPGEGMAALNQALAHDFPPDYFAVTFCAMLDPEARTVTYCKATLEPGIILTRDRRIALLDKGTGLAPGAFDPEVFGETHYEEHVHPFLPGETLLLFTDGITEIVDPERRQVRLEGLLHWLQDLHGESPKELVESLLDRARAFAGKTDFPDDLTLLATRFREDQAP
jgi:sigma-B regulation protein RsbU (phosphoserine phosphatase)